MSGATWPTDPRQLTVRFPFGDVVVEGVVRDAFLTADVRGPRTVLRVLVDGEIYRTTKREAEPVPDRY